ncbi:ADP-ribosylglycohydrolase family protein [Planococcus sp. APC 4015]|nr:ADP-ribosylglycohydrolase family protein [Planococcus sp. APC 4015]
MSSTRWLSKSRGLVLGLSLGDAAAGSGVNDPRVRVLHAGAATELAAWTIEGLLREFVAEGWAITAQSCEVQHAYQRWALLRGAHPTSDLWNPVATVEGSPARGWLLDELGTRAVRGSSPSMLSVVTTGLPSQQPSSRAIVKGLPYAILAGADDFVTSGPDKVAVYAGLLASRTHTHPEAVGGAAVSTLILAHCLRATEPLRTVMESCRDGLAYLGGTSPLTGFDVKLIIDTIEAGAGHPGDGTVIRRLAPDDSALSSLRAAIYVAMSCSEADDARQALELSAAAPDQRSVAAIALAFLGALRGYEALPQDLVNRLELGWTMDRLAIDLATRVSDRSWDSSDDARLRTKYPA